MLRDAAKNQDHVISIAGVGEVQLSEDIGGSEIKTTFESRYRQFEIKQVQPRISIEVIPKTIELLKVSSQSDGTEIALTSDGQVTIRSSWHRTTVDLGEISKVRLKKNLVGGARLEFDMEQWSTGVDLADAKLAADEYNSLRDVLPRIAPHIEFRSGWNWRLIGGGVVAVGSVAVMVLLVLGLAYCCRMATPYRILVMVGSLLLTAILVMPIMLLEWAFDWEAELIYAGAIVINGVLFIIAVSLLVTLLILRSVPATTSSPENVDEYQFTN